MMNEPIGPIVKMYPAVCSSCSKSTTVPFEPAKGRPVYCEDCLEKVQAGKVRTAGWKEKEQKASDEFSYDLANIGIEFEIKKPPKTPERPVHVPERPAKRLEEVRSSIPVEEKRISFSELKPSVQEPRPPQAPERFSPLTPPAQNEQPRSEKDEIDKPEKPKSVQQSNRPKVDIEELRGAIQESLKKALEED